MLTGRAIKYSLLRFELIMYPGRADILMWSFCAEFSLKSEVDESFEIHVLMNFLRVTWLTIKDSLQSKVFLGIFKYIALKTSALHTKRWSMQRTKFFILFCSSIQEKWHPSLVLLLRTRWKLLQFRNETTFLLFSNVNMEKCRSHWASLQ